jgi:hypothetical protein
MQIELEASLDRWTQAALLNFEQVARIREYETARAPRRSGRVPIWIFFSLPVSGHTAKHVLAALATYLIFRWRRMAASGAANASAPRQSAEGALC